VNDWDLWDVAQSKSVERSREIDLIFERLIGFRDIEFVSREIEYGFEKYSTTNMLFMNNLYYCNLNRDDINRFREMESIFIFIIFLKKLSHTTIFITLTLTLTLLCHKNGVFG
jgi:hypothetical protein